MIRADLEITRTAYRKFDVAIEDIVRRARADGTQVPCRPGCSACCSSAAQATPFEIPVIIEAVRAMTPEMRAKVLRGLKRWGLRLAEAGVDITKADPPIHAYESARAMCPFLFEHRCSIYEARPIACRAHYVVGPDAKACANRIEEPDVTVISPDEGVTKLIAWLADEAFEDERQVRIGVGLFQTLVASACELVDQPAPDYAGWIARGLGLR